MLWCDSVVLPLLTVKNVFRIFIVLCSGWQCHCTTPLSQSKAPKTSQPVSSCMLITSGLLPPPHPQKINPLRCICCTWGIVWVGWSIVSWLSKIVHLPIQIIWALVGFRLLTKLYTKIQTHQKNAYLLRHGHTICKFLGNPLCQVTKRQLAVEQLKMMKNEMTYLLFGWVVVQWLED